MKWYLYLIVFGLSSMAWGQDTLSNYRTKKMRVADTLMVDDYSINPSHFILRDQEGNVVDSTYYRVDYTKGLVILNNEWRQRHDSVTIDYLRYPLFLTREYRQLDPSIIVSDTRNIDKLIALGQSNYTSSSSPFEGLDTQGSITRGITVGNNQNATVTSELDLQITGKLSDKVSIRASLQDANIPTQEGGYSQSLDEFDQIFIELYGDDWSIRAGDVDLRNSQSYFGKFTKKIQGISLYGRLNHEDGSSTSAFASGGLVRGVFQRSQFNGQEGNQGPYKLTGPNGELYILIVSGSERVYINGLLLERGENADYVIDYNAGELRFNPTYPITANMRITVEYQFTERSYTRFIGYGGGNYESETLKLGAYVYSESDAKNQPLQQNLSEEQVQVLKDAGDNPELMTAPSAVLDTYSENKILYKKEVVDGEEIFVFSNDPEDELYNVRFTLVGTNQGNYVIGTDNAISRIYEYVAPINGVPQGNYEPIIRLNAPVKLQIGGLNGSWAPSEKTQVDFEIAGSVNDLNLFSNIDNDDNEGYASHLDARHTLFQTTDTLKVVGFGSWDFIHEDFQTVERLYNIEFNRDWNLVLPKGDQNFIGGGVEVSQPKIGMARYEFERLDYSENFTGNKHNISVNGHYKGWQFQSHSSFMNSEGDSLKTKFNRSYNNAVHAFKKAWVGAKVHLEDNTARITTNDSLTALSQRFTQYEMYTGIGDSTQVYVEVGYRYRVNDSIRNNILSKVNTSNDYFIKSRLINNENTQLSIFANYRELNYTDSNVEDEKNLNTRLLYQQALWKGLARLNTVFESNNGVLAQQEFTYVKVDQGQGTYTWIDYNENGVQELDEFEIAQFQDQAEYIRVLLPNQVFVRIRNNKFSQLLTLQPQQWSDRDGLLKLLSKFYNQTSLIIDRKVRRNNDLLSLNPFEDGGDDQLGLNLNFKNVVFFNRGKQRYTTSYTYIKGSNSNLISLGLQKNSLESHQLNFSHQFQKLWLASLRNTVGRNSSTSENFLNRNYRLKNFEVQPKITYLLTSKTQFSALYQYMNENNELGEMEELAQQKLGVSFSHNNLEKFSVSGEFNYIDNQFEGSAFSPVAYTMLEGLQPGTNFTWNLLFQKRITKYLDLNLTYFGRKSESSKAVHTGSVQLRAFF